MFACVESQHEQSAPGRERVALVLGHLDQLPTLPGVVGRLLQVTSSEESSADDVVNIIKSDASMTAAVLRLVQRADLGLHGKAMTVAQAVTLVGFRTLRNALLSSQFCSVFADDSDNTEAADARCELWKHSLAVGCASAMIAERGQGGRWVDEAFVCGLLHDIGKIALDACLPKSYALVVKQTERRDECICDVERETFGLDHTAAGKHLTTRWGLPECIVECAWLHHQDPNTLPSSVTSVDLIRIVHLADNLVRRERIGYSGYQYVADLSESAKALGLDSHDIDSITEALPDRVKSFCAMVGADGLFDSVMDTEALIAANRQLADINDRLARDNRDLEIRSSYFSALEQFIKQAPPQGGIADVCAAAAQALAQLVKSRRAMGVWTEPATECMHLGAVDLTDGRIDTLVVALTNGDVAESKNAAVDGADASWCCPAGSGLIEAPITIESIWRRCFSDGFDERLWLLPLRLGNGAPGGIIVEGSPATVGKLSGSTEECELLATAIAGTLAATHQRIATGRMSEELLDHNRRWQAAQKQLVRVRSIAMVAKMAAGAAHELNNPLAVISARAQMIVASCDDGETKSSLEIMLDQTQRASAIVMELMHFAKPPQPQPILRRLGDALESLCQHWRGVSSIGADRMKLMVVDPAATVFVDPIQLREVLDAVMANTLDATSPETAIVKINSPSHASDETVRIVIEDNGVGMTPKVLEHAIDPFYSSRPAGRGRGLGLSRAHRLVALNGGRLRLDSRPGKGTTVRIEFPARAPGS